MKRKLVNSGLFFYLIMSLLTIGCGSDDNMPNTEPPVEINELKGKLTESITLKANTTYSLIGGYEIEEGGVLTIEEGVTIIPHNPLTERPITY